jgi:hypothetical protein
MPSIDDLQAQADQHDALITQLQALRDQAAATTEPPFAPYNKQGQVAWRAHKTSLINSINKRISDTQAAKKQVVNQVNKLTPKPLTENQALAADARSDKQTENIATQKTQKDLASSKLEQQKAADAASIPAIGANGQSLKDLMTNSKITRDANGDYVFTQDNTGAKPTPLQAAKAKQLATLMSKNAVTDAPEAVFASGVPPVFDAKGNADPTKSNNPYIGTKGNYDAMVNLYNQSQPAATTELTVPATALNAAYGPSRAAYGPTFPGNPVAQDAATPAIQAFVDQSKGDLAPALAAAGTDARLSQPVSLGLGYGNAPIAAPPVLGTEPTDSTAPLVAPSSFVSPSVTAPALSPLARAKSVLAQQTLESGGLSGSPEEIASRFKKAASITPNPKEQAEIVAADTADQNAKEAAPENPAEAYDIGNVAYKLSNSNLPGYLNRAQDIILKANPATAVTQQAGDYIYNKLPALSSVGNALYGQPSSDDIRKQYLEGRRTGDIDPNTSYEDYAAAQAAIPDSSQDLPTP